MVDVMRLKQDENYDTKVRILKTLDSEGYIDKIKANLRSEVIRVLEKEKKQAFGGASKYLKQSELATTVTKKVVSNEDGLMCAEIIREFLEFYKMEHSLHVFVPEMSLSDFPKSKQQIEREVGIVDKDVSKPLLLRLLEQVKFGGPGPSASSALGFDSSPQTQMPESNLSSKMNSLGGEKDSPEMSSPDPTTKKENSRKSKKDSQKKEEKAKAGAKKEKKDKQKEKNDTAPPNSMAKLDDLPSLGGGMASKIPATQQIVDDDSGGFGDFNFDEDHIGDSSNKFSDAEKHLKDFYKEENEGFKVEVPSASQNAKNRAFNVRIDGVNAQTFDDDDMEEDIIEEDIQTDRDEQNAINRNIGNGLTESGGNYATGITVSQSLGVDPSVDSLAIDEYDHIEQVQN